VLATYRSLPEELKRMAEALEGVSARYIGLLLESRHALPTIIGKLVGDGEASIYRGSSETERLAFQELGAEQRRAYGLFGTLFHSPPLSEIWEQNGRFVMREILHLGKIDPLLSLELRASLEELGVWPLEDAPAWINEQYYRLIRMPVLEGVLAGASEAMEFCNVRLLVGGEPEPELQTRLARIVAWESQGRVRYEYVFDTIPTPDGKPNRFRLQAVISRVRPTYGDLFRLALGFRQLRERTR
jgi:hypothetical protein